MLDDRFYYRSLVDTAADLRRRQISSVELTQALLQRIEAEDPHLHSFLYVTPELAIAQARRADEEIGDGRYRGPLHGVPVAVKDLCFTAGIPTTSGSLVHRKCVPRHDATIVTRLARAGAVLLGKLHMTEAGGMEHHPSLPRPVSAWHPDQWPGVSSSGCGVATSAGLCFASIGSDTGGSIRFPSAANGLTGVRPTWGLVSRHGIFDLAPSYDTLGPLARSAADAAVVLGAIAGEDSDDPTTILGEVPNYLAELTPNGARGIRVGIDWRYVSEGAADATISMLTAVTAILGELGSELLEISLPDTRDLTKLLGEIHMTELALSHAETYPRDAALYSDWMRRGLERGTRAPAVQLARATIQRDRFSGHLRQIFKDVDALLLPVFLRDAPSWNEVCDLIENDPESLFRFTIPSSGAGVPSVTLPGPDSARGWPCGFQIVGPHRSEALLLRVAHSIQQATDWHLRHPRQFSAGH